MEYAQVIDLVRQTKDIILNEEIDKAVRLKGKADFVTAIDVAVSNFLKEKLLRISPSIQFFSEEETGVLTDSCWILDPIDGTTNLVFGYRMSSVSLGLYQNGKILFGVVYNPYTDECFTAERGKGAFLGAKRLQVSKRRIEESLIEFGAGSTHKENTDYNFEIAKDIFRCCIDVRRICSSALDLCFVADGRIDGYFEKVLKPWDIAAGSLILEEAGGKITDYAGDPVQFAHATSVIVSNGVVHDFLRETIEKHSMKK